MYFYIERLARLFALLGGLVLSVLIVLTCLSVVGRSLNGLLHTASVQAFGPWVDALLDLGIGPINGDFELVEAGMAFAIFAFLPLCQLNGAHASVDIFTAALPQRAKLLLRTLIDIVFAAVLVLIAWQLFEGLLSKRSSGQTTFLLEFPVWWAYAFSLSGAGVAALVSVYVACMHVAECVTGQRVLPQEMEAEH